MEASALKNVWMSKQNCPIMFAYLFHPLEPKGAKHRLESYGFHGLAKILFFNPMKHQHELRLCHRLWCRDWKCGDIWSWIICGSQIIQMQGRIKWHQSALDRVLGFCNMLKYKLQTVLQRLKMWGQWIEDYLRTVEADYPPSTPILWPSAPHKYTDKKQKTTHTHWQKEMFIDAHTIKLLYTKKLTNLICTKN